jgi:hypothetical protein
MVYSHSQINGVISNINECIEYLHSNTRFLLSEFPDKLDTYLIKDIIEVIKKYASDLYKKYPLDEYTIAIARYSLQSYDIINDGNHLILRTHPLNINLLYDSIIDFRDQGKHREILIFMYGCQCSALSQYSVNMYNNISMYYDIYESLIDDYKYEFLRYVYERISSDRKNDLPWSEDECNKFLNI